MTEVAIGSTSRKSGGMAHSVGSIHQAISDLEKVLRLRLPTLLDSLNAPVSDEDLKALKRAIAPYDLPSDYEVWLRFADGQKHGAGWWPVIDGPLLCASQVIGFYQSGLEFQPPGLLPISYASHYQVSIELAASPPAALIDTTVSSVEWQVIAPSLAAMLRAVTQLVESGHIDDWPSYFHFDGQSAEWDVAVKRLEDRRRPITFAQSEFLRGADWSGSPFPQDEWFDSRDGPSYWGPFPGV